MHFLRVVTKPDLECPDHFIVQWTNTKMSTRTPLRVYVPSDREDRGIIAELFALQYLLEVKEVLGHNQAGNADINLIVSFGAIKKLDKKGSAKRWLVDYAKFLTTRFKGCVIDVDKDERWFGADAPIDTLDATLPIPETIRVHGFGEVSVSSHIVDQFAERMEINPEKLGEAWRMLRKIACDNRVREIQKTRIATRMKYASKGRDEGRYFYLPNKETMMVVANDANNLPKLVTVYKICWRD